MLIMSRFSPWDRDTEYVIWKFSADDISSISLIEDIYEKIIFFFFMIDGPIIKLNSVITFFLFIFNKTNYWIERIQCLNINFFFSFELSRWTNKTHVFSLIGQLKLGLFNRFSKPVEPKKLSFPPNTNNVFCVLKRIRAYFSVFGRILAYLAVFFNKKEKKLCLFLYLFIVKSFLLCFSTSF